MKKGKQNKFQNNGEYVQWMKGMENYKGINEEINQNENIDIFDKNIKNITTNITENDKMLCDDLILGKNSANKEKNEINGKNLIILNNINNFDNSNEFFNEDEIKANKNLFKDVLQQDDINNIYYNELKNNNKENE